MSLVSASSPSHIASAPPGAIDAERLAHAPGQPDQWLTTGRDAGGNYFSPLADINSGNVTRLGFAWEYRLGTRRGLEATPVVVDGAVHVRQFWPCVRLDAASGRAVWTYDPEIDAKWGGYACCDAINRGVAVRNGRVYVGALDGFLHAIDASSGRRIWKVDTLPARGPKTPYTLSAAPVIAGNEIIVGSAAPILTVCGATSLPMTSRRARFVGAFTPYRATPPLGRRINRTCLRRSRLGIPATNGSPAEGAQSGMASPTIPTCDSSTSARQTGLLTTSKRMGERVGTICSLRRSSRFGLRRAMAWYYQTTPGDRWDYDSTQKFILTEIDLGNGPRKVLIRLRKMATSTYSIARPGNCCPQKTSPSSTGQRASILRPAVLFRTRP